MNAHGGKEKDHYEIRNKEVPNVQKHSNSLFDSSFLCKGIVNYNGLTIKEKSAKSVKALTKLLQNRFLVHNILSLNVAKCMVIC